MLKESRIKFIQASVEEIDLLNKKVKCSDRDESIEYDQIVLSVGARPRIDLIPGAKEHALPFYTIEDSYKLKKYLRIFRASDKPVVRVAVIGGGYSGVEVATSISQSLGKDRALVTIIDRNARIMSTSPAHNRMTAEK